MTTKSLYVGKAIHEEIKDIAPVFPIIAEKGTKYPFIVYRRVGFDFKDTKDYYNFIEKVTVEVSVIAETYTESLELAEKVKSRIEKTRGEFQGVSINEAETIQAVENWSNDAYIQTLTFSMIID